MSDDFRPWKEIADECLQDGIGDAFFGSMYRACRRTLGSHAPRFVPVDAKVDWDASWDVGDGVKRPTIKITLRGADGSFFSTQQLIHPVSFEILP